MGTLRRSLWAPSVTLFLSLGLTTLTGCPEDPDDPKTWIKKLDDVREQKDALRNLSRLKSEAALEPLTKLFKRGSDTEILRVITKLKSDNAVDLFIEQMDFSEDNFENAVVAANGLYEIAERDEKGREAAKKAVPALIKAVIKKLPIKTRANVARAESMKALAATKDPRAVEPLTTVLETSADEQDFFLNKQAAKFLAEFADPKSIPSLVRGLWMTGRGNDIFQDCRLALVRIGEPSVDKLVETMQRKNPQVEADAKKYEFVPGIVVQKAAIVLGDLRSKKAVAPLLAELQKKDEGLQGPCATSGNCVSGQQSVLQSLGFIGDTSVTKTLLGVMNDGKRDPKHRAAAGEALNMLGNIEALPGLVTMSKTSFITPPKNKDDLPELDQVKATLAAQGVTQLSRLTDKDETATIEPIAKAIPADIVDIKKVFENAIARSKVAAECKKDIACYGKYLSAAGTDPETSAKAERAAFSLARLGHDAVPALVKSIGHKDSAVRSAVMFALTRTATKADKDVLKAMDDQINVDKGRDKVGIALAEEMRITRAIVQNRE